MGISDRDYYQDEYQESSFAGFGGSSGNSSIIVKLIIINVAIFLVVFFGLGQNIGLTKLLMVTDETVMKPWLWFQFLTAGFAHDPDNIFHILGNMFTLYFLGRIVEFKYGSKKFLSFYLTAIVLGNLGFALRHVLMGSEGACLGASGGVVASVLVFALSFPKQIVQLWGVISIPAWVVGAMIIVFDVLNAFNPDSHVAHDVHLIGAAYGYLFFKTGWDFASGFPSKLFKKKRRAKVRIFDPDKRYEQLDIQADKILEKLHKEGEASLSSKERKILAEYSRRMQQKRK